MQQIKEQYCQITEISKSRFLSYVQRCKSEEEAKEIILNIKKQHPDANHHCYAYVIGEHHEISRSSDDREPSGTAGVPILEAVRYSGVINCICVVVRYFGGVKLGAGGLVRAYSSCASKALQNASKTELKKAFHYQMTFPYEWIGKFDYLLGSKNAIFLSKDYTEYVFYDFYVFETSFVNEVMEITSGNIHPIFVKETMIEV